MPRSLENTIAYTGGEFSPLMDARVDHSKYQVACRQLQNLIVQRQGGATRRPGLIYKALAKYQNTDFDQYAARLMSFQFSPTTSFMLEFGHQYIRFYSNQQQVTISSAPAWVSGTAYVKGDFVEDPGDSNNIYYCISDVTGTTQPHLDSTHWTAQTIYEVPTPYNAQELLGPSIYNVDVWRIVPCQINDVIYLVHPSYPPYKLTRYADTDWVFEQVTFLIPALMDQNATGVLMAASATTGTGITITASAPSFASGHYYTIGQSVSYGGNLYTCLKEHTGDINFVADNVDGRWKLETPFSYGNIGGYFQIGQIRNATSVEIQLTSSVTSSVLEATGRCTFDTYGTWDGDVNLQRSDDGGTTWYTIRTISSRSDNNGSVEIDVAGVALFRMDFIYLGAGSGSPRAVFTIIDSTAYGLVKITGVTDATHATGDVIKKIYNTNTTNLWSEGAWSDRRGYPQAVTSYQQRMIYGGTSDEPQRIWGTVTNDLENFDLGDQLADTDSIVFDIAAISRGRIQWLIGQVDLFIGFSGAEWVVNAGQGSFGGSTDPITPTKINAGEHSAFGSAEGVPPILVGNSVLYTQRSAKTIQQMTFSVYTNKYMSADLTSLSEHLFQGGIVQLAYQAQFRNQSMVWAATKTGALCCLTHDMQSEIYAWSRHLTGVDSEIGTINRIESVACIDGQGTQDDEVWVVVNRSNGRMIELMNPNNWETSDIRTANGIAAPDQAAAIYVDSAISVTSPGSNVITGLDHLVSQSVIGVLNGTQSFGPYEVQPDGSITIDGYEPTIGDILHIGLPMPYYLQPMRFDVDGRAGLIQAVMKAISRVYLRLFNSCGGKVQGTNDKKTPINYQTQAGPLIGGVQLFTGQKEVNPQGTQSYDPTMIIQGDDPFPITVLATITRMGITGSA